MIAQFLQWWRNRRQNTEEADDQRPQPRDRDRMLQRVRDRIQGLLEDCPNPATRIVLRLARWPDVVQHGQAEPRQPDGQPTPLQVGTTVSAVFNEADSGLLILGPPGSGKTTVLLELARDLLDQAEADQNRPIPVVFNLSSWAQRQPPFAHWLVEEVHHSYEVPWQIAEYWVNHGAILPLLDGLDEVAEAHRAGCVEAINEFRRVDKLVVCSAIEEYRALDVCLRLGDAVVLQPLAVQDV
jgi:hypothetical protein